ncbi:MAG: putative toxin-antitoxin system toxin component, PIN family [Planctomycetaceae bacterium]|nr:putative toxin-antitoxin system toxin component, PIN family [Planctomycetaceae bacterium]
MRVVLDTNVLARAAGGPPSPAAELLTLCLESPRVLCVSPFQLSELSRVLRYERVRRLHGMSDEVVDQFLQYLQAASLTVELAVDSVAAVVTSDPDDDPIVATAVVAAAKVLCTLDRHLRTPAVVGYCAAYGIDVVTDVELLQRLRPADQ